MSGSCCVAPPETGGTYVRRRTAAGRRFRWRKSKSGNELPRVLRLRATVPGRAQTAPRCAYLRFVHSRQLRPAYVSTSTCRVCGRWQGPLVAYAVYHRTRIAGDPDWNFARPALHFPRLIRPFGCIQKTLADWQPKRHRTRPGPRMAATGTSGHVCGYRDAAQALAGLN